jgi:putative hydrolase of HD superfamily
MHEKILEFLKIVGKLKKIERTGWITNAKLKPEECESVAEHIFRCAVLAALISDIKHLNFEKIVKMVLLHDLQEAIMGDWDTYAKEKFGEAKFRERERESINKLLSILPEEVRDEYSNIWNEFLEQKTQEANIAKQIDKLEMVLQALEYMEEGYNKEALNIFFYSSKEVFKDEDFKKLYDLLDAARKNLKSS